MTEGPWTTTKTNHFGLVPNGTVPVNFAFSTWGSQAVRDQNSLEFLDRGDP